MNTLSLIASRGRRSHRFLGFTACLISLVAATACFGAVETILGKVPSADAVATIDRLEEESCVAVKTADYAAMERLWSEEFVVNSPGNFVVPNRAEVFELFRKREKNGRVYSVYEKEIECITFSGDLAIVMGTDAIAPPDAPPTAQPGKRRYTNIWRLANGRWLLIARQATMLAPVAPPVNVPAAPKS